PALLAPVGDPKALASVMLRALDQPVDKATLLANAARFSVERSIDGYEALIADVLARHRPPATHGKGSRSPTPGRAT
ncbi:MAG: hypothetical protein OXF26_14535, partial [Alphaproteobacteria bacterium]|nr:hypothetical protein [Alphaproteobacteria bacterium]